MWLSVWLMMRSIIETASTGQSPGGRFRRQHHGIGAVVDGGRDVGRLGPRRRRRLDHRFEHLRRDDHRLAGRRQSADQLLLPAGHVLRRDLDAEIAARHHDARRPARTMSSMRVERRRLLDLGHDAGAALDQALRLDHVGRPLHERQRHPVDAEFEPEGEVARGPSSVSGEIGRSVSGRFTPLRSRQHAADHDARVDDVVAAAASPRARSLPSSIIRLWPGIMFCEHLGMRQRDRVGVARLAAEDEAHACRRSSSVTGPSFSVPMRIFGPCRSCRMPIGRPTSFSSARIAS